MNSIASAVPSFSAAFSASDRGRLGAALFEQSATAIAVVDLERRVVWANEACARLTGVPRADLVRDRVELLEAGRLGQAALTQLILAMDAGKPWHGPLAGVRPDGTPLQATLSLMPVTPAATDEADAPGSAMFLAILADDAARRAPPEAFAEEFPLYERAVENSPDGLVVIDRNGVVAFCNASAARLLSSTVEHLTGRQFGIAFGAAGQTTAIELFVGGKPKFVEMTAAAIGWKDEDATLVTLRDVSAQRDVEFKLDLQSKALATAANGIFITDASGVIQWANAAMEAMSGYRPEELIGRTSAMFRSGKHPRSFYRQMWERLQRGETWQGRTVNRHKAGHPYTAEQTITPVRDATGRIAQFVSIQEDISERLKAQDEIIRLAQYDTLTDLPNRHLFIERLNSAVARAKRAGEMIAVMLLDLDNFKVVNTNLGHDVGDGLLVAAKGRLNAQLRTTDTLARIGGDEFAVLLEGIHDMGAANATIKRIFDSFADPITVGPHTFKAAASAGIAIYPKDDTDPVGLLSQAELAMYQAKAEGRHTFCYFDRDADIRRRMNLESELQQAIDRGQLWLAYQPQVDLASGRVVGAEALIRWTHPDRGLVSPGDFIPLAESSDLILSIGEWIIREICRQSDEWRTAGLPKLQLGFNVSGVQFRRADLHGQVTAMLAERGLGPEAIDIEVTESVAMERSARVQENFGRLTEAGISISMDDFGTGYSSLSNLSAFPVTRLKVDGSFVSGIGRKRDAEKIVEAVVGLGRSLDLRVVAEGVETVEQARFLKHLQCDEIQGYLVSKPLPPDAFRQFVGDFKGLPV